MPADLVVRDPDKLRWGTVSTILARLRGIARFATYHLDIGAAEVNIFLDVPGQVTADFFAGHSTVKIHQCTPDYWDVKPIKLTNSYQLRQTSNATRCYRRTKMHWLAHIDVDEFLLSPEPVGQLLGTTPPDAAFVGLGPAEMLAQPDPCPGPVHFELTRKELGPPSSVLEGIHPEFGAFAPKGFISNTGDKNLARSGARASNGQVLRTAHVGHAHAPSWEVFNRTSNSALKKGAYRRKLGETKKLPDVIKEIPSDEGDAGVRQFFAEMCAATPELLSKLAKFGFLLTTCLDLDSKVARWFGDLPKPASRA